MERNCEEHIGDVTDKMFDWAIKELNEQSAHLNGFRKSLADAAALELSSSSGPLVFVIDELDRCRPDVALQIIELIKHVFSVDNVCFLLVMNKKLMECSVKSL